jgi:cytochrome c biogenesis protein ResB
MENLKIKKTLVLLLLLLVSVSVCEAQRTVGKPDRAAFGKSLKTKQVKVREPPSIEKAKRKQEAKEKKLKKEYNEYVEQSRKRAVKIQSPEVQDRMIQNRKDADRRYKIKKKKREENFRRAGHKF